MSEQLSPIESAQQLAVAIRDVHRQVFVRTVQAEGLPEATWENLHEHQDHITTIVNNSGEGQTLIFGDVAYEETTRYPINLLGNSALSFIWSGTPFEVLEHHKFDSQPNRTTGIHVVSNDIELDAKMIDIRLHGRIARSERARIYIANDIPPTALFMDDLNHVDKELRKVNRPLPDDSLQIIDAIEAAFGPGATEVLTPARCLTLSKAIRLAGQTATTRGYLD